MKLVTTIQRFSPTLSVSSTILSILLTDVCESQGVIVRETFDDNVLLFTFASDFGLSSILSLVNLLSDTYPSMISYTVEPT